jgi:hypothetical protein
VVVSFVGIFFVSLAAVAGTVPFVFFEVLVAMDGIYFGIDFQF